MAIQTDPTEQSEEVIVVVRPEGSTIPPSDMQCAAQGSRKGTRHKEDIYWDEELELWSSLCEKHTNQNDEARLNKAKKVVLFKESK